MLLGMNHMFNGLIRLQGKSIFFSENTDIKCTKVHTMARKVFYRETSWFIIQISIIFLCKHCIYKKNKFTTSFYSKCSQILTKIVLFKHIQLITTRTLDNLN